MTERAAETAERSILSTWGYLIFLGFILLGPTFDPDPEPYQWSLEISVVLVAAATFIWAELGGVREKWIGAAVLMSVAFAATPFGSSAISVLPIYAAALVASYGTRRQVWVRLGAISLLTLIALIPSPLEWPFVLFLAFPAVFVWIIGMAVHDDATLANRADALRAENVRIEYLATVTERERISRDLHDVAGQTLTGLILRSQLVQRLAADDPDRARTEATTIEIEARELLSRFRETVAGWQQASLSEELDGAGRALRAASIELMSRVQEVQLAPSVETVLALALRESVTNVVRHSSARTCRVSLSDEDGFITMRIQDDGVGRHDGAGRQRGSGLRGMRERVIAAGGDLDIADEAGTSVTITFPAGAHT